MVIFYVLIKESATFLCIVGKKSLRGRGHEVVERAKDIKVYGSTVDVLRDDGDK